MRWYKGPEGDERLWLEPSEIEEIVEDELRKAGLVTSADSPSVDIERFIEVHLGAELDQYADLESDVLGVTEFRPGMTPTVMINRDLTGSAMDGDWSPPGIQGRWRATLAHEGAHCLFHRVLFELNADQGSLFEGAYGGGRSDHRMMRCLKRQVSFQRQARDWREVQANRGMAALLMPRPVFLDRVRREFANRSGERVLAGTPEARALAEVLASIFAVSRQAAEIRLSTMGFLGAPRVPELAS